MAGRKLALVCGLAAVVLVAAGIWTAVHFSGTSESAAPQPGPTATKDPARQPRTESAASKRQEALRALPGLMDTARDAKKSPAERLAAADSVVKLEVRGAKTLEFFGQLSKDPDPAIAGFGLGTLAAWEDLEKLDKEGKALDVVLVCTGSKEKQVLRNAALALKLMSSKKAVGRMVELMADEDRLVRVVLADGLKDLGAPINKDKVRDAKLAGIPEELKGWLEGYEPGKNGEEKAK